ncbi:unnamed protein product [Acanthoscelides obtectus]|uniref:Uncharacterized protein n=1 Tax=Acanthoscelides obtectus TaxID=200917 RepID=A0A9P0MIB7_ACAOB|nr:unnamed protein product [Acanthoscelides obtectus]CAK1635372.1 hypothetical protein AOBTE_LOCUS9238 [Acanthoscelides obtectus]
MLSLKHFATSEKPFLHLFGPQVCFGGNTISGHVSEMENLL